MATRSKIEWTHTTWNPVSGCTKISAGCKNCYAERMAMRLKAMGVERYRRGFDVSIHHDLLDQPLMWRQPRLVFVNSMSDLFHESVPNEFIVRIFETMERCPQHTFQILTKRSKRLLELADSLPWPNNVWMGVTVEDDIAVHRICHLAEVPAAVRFLSCEPLLGPIEDIPLSRIDWVIVGGESGPHARRMQPEWARALLRQCRQAEIPFFFKQWGGTRKKAAGRLLDGRIYDEIPCRSVNRRGFI